MANTLETNQFRRGFLRGLAGILAAGVAPAFIGSKILMPVKQIAIPTTKEIWRYGGNTLFSGELGMWENVSFIITTKSANPGTTVFTSEWTEI